MSQRLAQPVHFELRGWLWLGSCFFCRQPLLRDPGGSKIYPDSCASPAQEACIPTIGARGGIVL